MPIPSPFGAFAGGLTQGLSPFLAQRFAATRARENRDYQRAQAAEQRQFMAAQQEKQIASREMMAKLRTGAETKRAKTLMEAQEIMAQQMMPEPSPIAIPQELPRPTIPGAAPDPQSAIFRYLTTPGAELLGPDVPPGTQPFRIPAAGAVQESMFGPIARPATSAAERRFEREEARFTARKRTIAQRKEAKGAQTQARQEKLAKTRTLLAAGVKPKEVRALVAPETIPGKPPTALAKFLEDWRGLGKKEIQSFAGTAEIDVQAERFGMSPEDLYQLLIAGRQ